MTPPFLDADRAVAIFRGVERTLLSLAEANLPAQAVRVGRELALAVQEPIRYIDIVLVAYGQVQTDELGLRQGICLSADPACAICGVRQYCLYDAVTGTRRP